MGGLETAAESNYQTPERDGYILVTVSQVINVKTYQIVYLNAYYLFFVNYTSIKQLEINMVT